MKISRRGFIKLTGAGALGLGLLPVKNVLAGDHSNVTSDGKRWAMVVDSRKCGECNDCIVACHKTHNVPEIDNKEEEIKWLWKEKYEHAFPSQKHDFVDEDLKKRPFMMLCNHCDNPACVRVCPTQATFKRKSDGIVMMDYHRCIGCRYCMAGCPYGARSFNFNDPRPFIEEINKTYPTRTKGVVEKCNFCAERLAKGSLPACVEACPNNALIFGDLNDPDSEVRKVLREHYTIQRKPDLGTRPSVYYIV
ncbi:MAG: hypothetical protein PWQ96_552 [Clostridia bacterium]|jgi:molybdopterin-containing oxidoreductase family iron-sulfur binding subunit|nr:4Fe-4S dicluster protein [Clostridiales bacterium]MDK2984910.1 hypothetical protein [Clostridia bacterium]